MSGNGGTRGAAPQGTGSAEDGIAEKVAFLRRPESFPDSASAIETVETHFAYVFLSRRFVYKLKKPVKHGQVDYTTRAARRASCELEVALNRRLAAPVYLGVVGLTRGWRGLELDGDGEPVDWLVQMRRLARGRTLERLATAGDGPSDRDLRALVDKLHRFYVRAATAPWGPDEYRRRLERSAVEAARRLVELGEDEARIGPLAAAYCAFVRERAGLLDARVGDGRIVDAHGDLRPEHVFLDGEPQIIDCLEFSQELRWLDSAEEIAFLALECDRLGIAGVGGRVLELYLETADDGIGPRLLAFYRARRALLRAVLAALRASKAERDAARWRERTSWYLRTVADALAAAGGAGRDEPLSGHRVQRP